jgi:hypothetical protein
VVVFCVLLTGSISHFIYSGVRSVYVSCLLKVHKNVSYFIHVNQIRFLSPKHKEFVVYTKFNAASFLISGIQISYFSRLLNIRQLLVLITKLMHNSFIL